MKNTASERTHIHEAQDGESEFVFHPESNDIFVRTGKEVIASCQIGISLQVWLDELRDLFRDVSTWAKTLTSVRAVFALPIGSRLVLYVAPAGSCFDFDLADSLALLNRSLVKNRPVIGMVEVLQVPWDDRGSFVSDNAKCIYGDCGTTH